MKFWEIKIKTYENSQVIILSLDKELSIKYVRILFRDFGPPSPCTQNLWRHPFTYTLAYA